jgi:endonuclease/exonuclease/phosphatase family metal-dependent hydrolase
MRTDRTLISILFTVICCVLRVTPCPAEDAEQTPASFVVATYNVKNLFDGRDDPYSQDERTVPVPKPPDEVRALAGVIRAVDADILALQEVESRGVLKRFRNGMLQDLRYGTPVQFEGNDTRGIDVAVLTRFAVGPVTSHRHLVFDREDGKKTRFSRDLLRIRVYPRPDFWFDLYVVHLKSGTGEEACIKRKAEADEVRRILDRELERDGTCPFLVVGDFNDGRESETIAVIEGTGDAKLFCPTDQLESGDRDTFFRDSRRARFDYIFCSPSMRDRYIEGSVRVVGGDEAARASDHRPVVAAFRMPDSP